MSLPVLFRCTQCGTDFSLDETKCPHCQQNFLSSKTILDFVIHDENLSKEQSHYNEKYGRQEVSGNKKRVVDLESLWTDPWKPQDQLVLDSLGDLKDKRVLLLGNGDSIKEMYLLSKKPQVLIYSDLSVQAMANIRDAFNLQSLTDSIKYVALDAQQLPFADECIDVIYGYAMVHHLPDLSRFFPEVTRVLAKGGHSVFMDDAYAPIWHYSKQTILRPLMKYSHKKSGISPEDYKFSMSGGYREKRLSEQIRAAGGIPWFKRTAFLQYLWFRGSEKILPKRMQAFAKHRFFAVVLSGIDSFFAKLPLVKLNLIRLVWGIRKADVK